MPKSARQLLAKQSYQVVCGLVHLPHSSVYHLILPPQPVIFIHITVILASDPTNNREPVLKNTRYNFNPMGFVYWIMWVHEYLWVYHYAYYFWSLFSCRDASVFFSLMWNLLRKRTKHNRNNFINLLFKLGRFFLLFNLETCKIKSYSKQNYSIAKEIILEIPSIMLKSEKKRIIAEIN